MTQNKLSTGKTFPKISVKNENGDDVELGHPANGHQWQMIVVYRGKHCPMCTKYLNELKDHKDKLASISVDLVAVSADSKAQLEAHKNDLDVNFPLYYGLTLEQMYELGVYISDPRSPEETDHPFSEPGLFVVNEDFDLHVVDISNNPFVRPDIKTLVSGLEWIKNPDNNYPIRGRHSR